MEKIPEWLYNFIDGAVEQIGWLGIIIIVATLFLIANAFQRAAKIAKAKKQNIDFEESDMYE